MADQPAGPIIEIRDVTKRFGTYPALRGIRFDIGRGEFFSLLGASGCGKTTLLRILAGIEEPTTGAVLIDGQDMAGIPPNRRPTNMVFQSYAIFPHLSVRENVGYGLAYRDLPKAEKVRRTDEAIAMVKLEGLGDRGAGQLSGGQRQRVALARALVLRPKVLLLDEPLSALDKKLREEMQHELRALQRSVGITFVFVTHDQEEALSLSDRIAVMSGGRVLQIDTPQGLYDRPRNREVAEFIGTMNLFPVKVAGVDGGRVVVEGAMGRWTLASDGPVTARGTAAHLALRPERLRFADRGRISGRLQSVAYLGDRSHYLVDVAGLDRPVTVFRPRGAPDEGPHVPGTDVQLDWDDGAARLLAE